MLHWLAGMTNTFAAFDHVIFLKDAEALMVSFEGGTDILLEFRGVNPQRLQFDDPATVAFFRADLERELTGSGWTAHKTEPTCLKIASGSDVAWGHA